MKIDFTPDGWEDYTYWQEQGGAGRKVIKRINLLLQDIRRNLHDGIGKPEPLTENLFGYWSRRIDEVNRLIYRIDDDAEVVEIYQCRGHYGDK